MQDSHIQAHLTDDQLTTAPTPRQLMAASPLAPAAIALTHDTRRAIINILQGRDRRLIAVVGPCAEDDSLQPDGTPSVLAFAQGLKEVVKRHQLDQQLLVVMRCCPAKPRSKLGGRGLEQTDAYRAYDLLAQIANHGLPVALEVMNERHLARYGAVSSLVWVGARNQDTLLRHTLSLFRDLPVWCKNGETGDLTTALASMETIAEAHDNPEIMTADGHMAHVRRSPGNPNTALIYRGGTKYLSPAGFEQGVELAARSGRPYAVDCAHGNEAAHDPEQGKSVAGQLACFDHLVDLMAAKRLSRQPVGVMVEAYLGEGNDPSGQTPGTSIVDPCISLEQLEERLVRLAEALSYAIK